jgi:sec-independent protein translocase protein TatA
MTNSLAVLPLLGMPGLGEWLIILAVVIIFFGATKLPQLGKGFGEGIRNFKKGLRGEDDEKSNLPVKDSSDDEKSSKPEE